jgi:hypothetical protein
MQNTEPNEQNPDSPGTTPASPPRVGRPTKFSRGVVSALCEAVELGCNLTEAAGIAGISVDTLRRWRDERPELVAAIEAAEARGIQKRLKTISDAAEDNPKWAAWILEHRWPDRWSRANRGQVQVHVNGDQPQVRVVDEELCDQISESWKRFEASRNAPNEGALEVDVPPDSRST